MGVVLLLLCGLLLLASCRKEPAVRPISIRLSFAEVLQDAPVLVALEKGYFRSEGLEVRPIPHFTGKECLQDVIEGRADVGTTADLPPALAAVSGEKRFVILAAFESSSRLTLVVARKDRGIRMPADLKGKRIAVVRGTSGEFLLHNLLVYHGLRPEDVRVEPVGPEHIPEAVISGETDAAVTWQPHAHRILARLGADGIPLYGDEAFLETFILVARPGFARENPEAARRVLRGLIRAENFLHEHPDEARRIMARRLGLDEPYLASIWKDISFNVSLDQSLLKNLEAEARWAIGAASGGSGKPTPNFLEYLRPEPLEAVKPGAVTIIR